MKIRLELTDEQAQALIREILAAVEFGYSSCEKGFNLQETIDKAKQMIKVKDVK